MSNVKTKNHYYNLYNLQCKTMKVQFGTFMVAMTDIMRSAECANQIRKSMKMALESGDVATHEIICDTLKSQIDTIDGMLSNAGNILYNANNVLDEIRKCKQQYDSSKVDSLADGLKRGLVGLFGEDVLYPSEENTNESTDEISEMQDGLVDEIKEELVTIGDDDLVTIPEFTLVHPSHDPIRVVLRYKLDKLGDYTRYYYCESASSTCMHMFAHDCVGIDLDCSDVFLDGCFDNIMGTVINNINRSEDTPRNDYNLTNLMLSDKSFSACVLTQLVTAKYDSMLLESDICELDKLNREGRILAHNGVFHKTYCRAGDQFEYNVNKLHILRKGSEYEPHFIIDGANAPMEWRKTSIELKSISSDIRPCKPIIDMFKHMVHHVGMYGAKEIPVREEVESNETKTLKETVDTISDRGNDVDEKVLEKDTVLLPEFNLVHDDHEPIRLVLRYKYGHSSNYSEYIYCDNGFVNTSDETPHGTVGIGLDCSEVFLNGDFKPLITQLINEINRSRSTPRNDYTISNLKLSNTELKVATYTDRIKIKYRDNICSKDIEFLDNFCRAGSVLTHGGDIIKTGYSGEPDFEYIANNPIYVKAGDKVPPRNYIEEKKDINIGFFMPASPLVSLHGDILPCETISSIFKYLVECVRTYSADIKTFDPMEVTPMSKKILFDILSYDTCGKSIIADMLLNVGSRTGDKYFKNTHDEFYSVLNKGNYSYLIPADTTIVVKIGTAEITNTKGIIVNNVIGYIVEEILGSLPPYPALIPCINSVTEYLESNESKFDSHSSEAFIEFKVTIPMIILSGAELKGFSNHIEDYLSNSEKFKQPIKIDDVVYNYKEVCIALSMNNSMLTNIASELNTRIEIESKEGK